MCTLTTFILNICNYFMSSLWQYCLWTTRLKPLISRIFRISLIWLIFWSRPPFTCWVYLVSIFWIYQSSFLNLFLIQTWMRTCNFRFSLVVFCKFKVFICSILILLKHRILLQNLICSFQSFIHIIFQFSFSIIFLRMKLFLIPSNWAGNGICHNWRYCAWLYTVVFQVYV
jgi:hypothetical protein